MLKYLSLTAAAGALAQQAFPQAPVDSWAAPANIPLGSGPNQAPAMDPMMMMMMMGDDGGSMSKLLPLMMMNGGMGGGQGGMGGMDPMMMMMMMGDDGGSMSDLLPLMMMSGGMGGGAGGGMGGMNPMMLMSLLDDKSSCDVKNSKIKALKGKGDFEIPSEDLASGSKFFKGANTGSVEESDIVDSLSLTQTAATEALSYVDYDFLACQSKDGGMGDLLPLMMMNGGMGGAQGGMDPMMMMMMMDGDGMDSLLPMLMMGGGMGGQAGGMNPMMMMMMMDDDKSSGCDKFKISSAFQTKDNGDGTFGAEEVTSASDIEAIFKADAGASTFGKDFKKCLDSPTPSKKKDSAMDKLLPFLMMGGQGGQQMDPMMMMMLMKD